MRTTLFHIPSELFGMPMFGLFGILFWGWLLLSLALLGWLHRKHGFSGEFIGYLPILGVLGLVIVVLLPRMSGPAGLPIRGYGVMLLFALMAAGGLAIRRAKQMGLDPEIIYSLAFWQFALGILGARLFYVIEYWDRFRRDTLLETLVEAGKLTEGGLVVYGGLIGGGLATLAFIHRRKLPGLALMDLIAPSVVLGMAIGRLGCFLNGCCFGGVCDVPWAVQFPEGSPPYVRQFELGQPLGLTIGGKRGEAAEITSILPDSPAAAAQLHVGDKISAINGAEVENTQQARFEMYHALAGEAAAITLTIGEQRISLDKPEMARSLPVHPTQIYSAINGALLCLVLLAWYPFRRRDGELVAGLLVLYPITRFLLEIIRTDEAAIGRTGLTISQNVSLIIIAIGIALFAWLWTQPKGSKLPVRMLKPA